MIALSDISCSEGNPPRVMRAREDRYIPARHLLADHVRRTASALSGFHIWGARWLRPWMSYALSPLSNKLSQRQTVHYADFNVRSGMCDLYTFANLFADYPAAFIRRALPEVDLVVDLGANVGAFSFLVVTLCKSAAITKSITAVEPDETNVEFLRRQPFADRLKIVHAAVGPTDGQAKLIDGINSVSSSVDFSDTGLGANVRVISLDSLCDKPALVKMDIEGGEWEILRHGLPPNVRHLLLEWHPAAAADGFSAPSDFILGNWSKISTDPWGATMWYFQR